jgi:hypothetical protein
MKPNPGFSGFDKTIFEVDDLEYDGAIFFMRWRNSDLILRSALLRASRRMATKVQASILRDAAKWPLLQR